MLTLESTERVVRARSGAVGAKADTLMAHARATRTEANFMVKVDEGLQHTAHVSQHLNQAEGLYPPPSWIRSREMISRIACSCKPSSRTDAAASI